MSTLAERKLALEKELRELEILERAAAIREEAADKEKRIESLILSLKDQPLFCKMPISSVAHIKTIFQSPLCSASCFFYDTCQSIITLTSKTTPARNTGKKGNSKEILKNEKAFQKVIIDKDFSVKGLFKFTVKNIPNIPDTSFEVPYPVNGTFEEFKESLKKTCPQSKKAFDFGIPKIMRTGQYQGLLHENSMKKLFK